MRVTNSFCFESVNKIKFDAMFDDQMFTFMEINTEYDDPDLDTMITIHKDLEILGRLYTK